jgi:signal transduction histidine kinase
MKKSLLFLSIIIIFSVAIIQRFVIPLFEDNVTYPMHKWQLEYLTSGTMDLLSEQLQRLPKPQRQAYLETIQTNIGFDLSLQEFKPKDFSVDQQLWLAQNKILAKPIADLVYRLIDNEQLLVIVEPNSIPKHLINEAQRWMMGTFYLLHNMLKEQPENEWLSIIESASDEFEYPVSLLTLSELNYGKEQMMALNEGGIVTIPTEDSDFIGFPADITMQRINNTDKVIVIGPFSPQVKPKILYMFSLYYLLFGLFLLIPIVMWLIPAWRSMITLNNAALLFGQGRFETRAKLIRFSHLNHLSNTFNTMAEKIQRLITSHKNLTNAVSHELRTPIARIEFNLELLRNTANNDYQLKQLDHIEFSLNELNSLVTEMLAHARFDRETPKLTFERVELKHWIREELKLWQASHPEIEIILTEDACCDAMIERFYMSRALSNLIRNAIAYGRTCVHASYRQTATGWQICIDDDGDGVPLLARDKVFDPFYREDESRNRQTGGTGLGLAIVQQIMDWHGGTASVDASVLGGARFILDWPEQNK